MSYVQTNTIAGQTASGDLGYIFPTGQQPIYASRFTSALENLAENGSNAAPFLSVPVASDGIVTLGRNLATPTAIQTPAAQTADMTLLFVARMPNAPVAGDGNAVVLGASFYNSASLSGWNGLAFVINNGNLLLYLGISSAGKLSTQYAGVDVGNAQAQSWGIYAARVTSSSGSVVSAKIQALTAGVSQSQTWAGTLKTVADETPTVMLGADYIPVFGISQSIQISRAFIWNAALSDTDIDAMTTLIRADLAQSGITI